ncbi:MAG TPA: hypothetical protein VNF99_13520 [Stellaceae bacterium]|nr:hypothetical protein [Stellaceae bacterium]
MAIVVPETKDRASPDTQASRAAVIRFPRRRTALSRQRNRILAAALAVIAVTVFATAISLVVVLHEAASHAVAAY